MTNSGILELYSSLHNDAVLHKYTVRPCVTGITTVHKYFGALVCFAEYICSREYCSAYKNMLVTSLKVLLIFYGCDRQKLSLRLGDTHPPQQNLRDSQAYLSVYECFKKKIIFQHIPWETARNFKQIATWCSFVLVKMRI